MAAKIPLVQSQDRDLNLFQTQLGKVLAPILENPVNFGVQLTSITLTVGITNSVPTSLNRTLQGWFLTRVRSQATIWDAQDSNASADKTLNLITSATVVVDLWVY